MTRITIKLMDGSKISLVSDEIASVTTGRATLGPARVSIHPQGEEESHFRTPDLLCAALRAVNGQERIDASSRPLEHPCDQPMPEDSPESMTRAGDRRLTYTRK